MLISFLKFLAVGLVLFFSNAHAAESPASNRNPANQMADDSDIVVRKPTSDSLYLGLDVRSYKYEEPGFVTHSGLMYGPWVEYVTNSSMGLIGVKANVLFGSLTYDGALCDSLNNCSPYSTSNQKDVIANSNFDFLIKKAMVFQWVHNTTRCKISLHTMPLLCRLFQTKFIQKNARSISFIRSNRKLRQPAF